MGSKVINGYLDYFISDKGLVFSKKTFKYLKPVRSSNGYLQVHLYKTGVKKTFYIHRLVATHFIKNPKNKTQVNHLDEVKSNNHYLNLEWSTPKENINHGNSLLKRSVSQSKKVLRIDPVYYNVKEYESLSSVKKDGFDTSNVSKSCRGLKKKVKGYYWKFKN